MPGRLSGTSAVPGIRCLSRRRLVGIESFRGTRMPAARNASGGTGVPSSQTAESSIQITEMPPIVSGCSLSRASRPPMLTVRTRVMAPTLPARPQAGDPRAFHRWAVRGRVDTRAASHPEVITSRLRRSIS